MYNYHPLLCLVWAGCYTRSRLGWLNQGQHPPWSDGSLLVSPQSSEVVLQWLLRLQGKSFFFLVLLAVAGFHSFPLLACLPSVCTCGGVFDGLAVSPLQTALGTRYLTPPQPLWCCAAFSPPLAAQPPAAGCPPPGHTFCRQVCCLSLCQEKGPAYSLHCNLSIQQLHLGRGIVLPARTDGAGPPAGAAVFTVRQVPTFLPWGSGGVSILHQCKWAQNGPGLWVICIPTLPLDQWGGPPSKQNLLACHALADTPHPACLPCAQCSWPLILPRNIFSVKR